MLEGEMFSAQLMGITGFLEAFSKMVYFFCIMATKIWKIVVKTTLLQAQPNGCGSLKLNSKRWYVSFFLSLNN